MHHAPRSTPAAISIDQSLLGFQGFCLFFEFFFNFFLSCIDLFLAYLVFKQQIIKTLFVKIIKFTNLRQMQEECTKHIVLWWHYSPLDEQNHMVFRQSKIIK
jgi:hypothetical protein